LWRRGGHGGLERFRAFAGLSNSQVFTFARPGTYPVYARVLDDDGGFSDYQTDVTVFPNDPPTAASATVVLPEDGTTALVLEGSDPETPVSELVFRLTSQPERGVLLDNGVPVTAGTEFVGSPHALVYQLAYAFGQVTDAFQFVTDAFRDTLNGGADLDWYFAESVDTYPSLKNGERLN
jgi:hypothetical protein